MKKKTYPQKRTTLLSLLLRGLLAAAIICAAFAGAFREYILYQIRTQTEKQMNEKLLNIQESIGFYGKEKNESFAFNNLSLKIAAYTYFEIYIDPPFIEGGWNNYALVNSSYSQNNHALCAVLDDDNNIVASNRQVIFTAVRLNEDEREIYICDNTALDIPQLDELFADFEDFYYRCGDTGVIEIDIDSIYYDMNRKIFIPHTGNLTLRRARSSRELLYEENEFDVEDEREINIDLDGMGYKTLSRGSTDIFPRFSMTMFMGVPGSEFEKYGNDFDYCINDEGIIDVSIYGRASGENFNEVTRTLPIYIGDKTYQMYMRFIVDENDPQFVHFHHKWVTIFSAVTLAAALLLCWRKNVLNKAKYAFEDFQRDLTDSLAHDIKTPLMAISGYTENVMNGKLSEAEQKEYLSAILDNVSFTDQLISRTLYLNHIGGKNTPKETVRLNDTAEEILAKYALMLQEKQITYSVTGNAEIKADRSAVETIIENLISNAVKYTPAGGSVRITINKKQVTIINTVEKKINTAELKRPFFRGDASRSNISGNGLGLAIADRAALANRFRLLLSCTDTEFKTELRY